MRSFRIYFVAFVIVALGTLLAWLMWPADGLLPAPAVEQAWVESGSVPRDRPGGDVPGGEVLESPHQNAAVDSPDDDLPRPAGTIGGPRLVGERRLPSAGSTLSGVVVNSDDSSPVGAAVVSLAGPGSAADSSSAMTDVEGRFEIDLPRSGRYRVSAGATGFVPVTFQRVFAGGSRPLEIKLRPHLDLYGRVIDAARHGVSEATVSIMADETVPVKMRIGHTAQTQADGSFEFPRLQGEGTYELVVAHPTYASHKESVRLPISGSSLLVQIGDRFEGDELLFVTGVVVDQDALPIPGATVTAWDNSGKGLYAGGAAEDGRFQTSALRVQGGVNVGASAPGYSRTRSSSIFVALEQVDSPPDVVLTLETELKLLGVVTNQSGVPIARAMVAAVGPHDLGGGDFSDEQGLFEISNLVRGTIKVTVRHGDYLRRETDVILPYREVLELVLERGLTLSGTVVLRESSPVNEFQLALVDPTTGRTLNSSRFVAEAGEFEIRGIRRGAHLLRLRLGDASLETPIQLDDSRNVQITVDAIRAQLVVRDFGGQ